MMMRASAPSALLCLPLKPPPLVAWTVVWVVVTNQQIAVAISNSFYVVFSLNSCPHTKSYPNGTKDIEVKLVIGRLWIVGPVSQKIAVFISNSLNVDFSPILAPKPNLIKIGQKMQKLVGFFRSVGLVKK